MKFSSVAIGKGRGSAGNMRFSVVKGQSIAAQKPVSVANPQSPKQTAQRVFFAILLAMYRAGASVFNYAYTETQNPLSPYNGFMRSNLNIAYTGVGSAKVFEPDNFMPSKGSLLGQADADFGAIALRSVPLEWASLAGTGNASGTDIAYVCVWDDNGNVIYADTDGNLRSDNGCTVVVPGAAALNTLHLGLWFVKADLTKASDSIVFDSIA